MFTQIDCSVWPIDMTIRCYHSRPEWTWEQWQWRDTPHSLNLQGWSPANRWFNVIFQDTCLWGGSYSSAISVFYSPSWLGWAMKGYLALCRSLEMELAVLCPIQNTLQGDGSHPTARRYSQHILSPTDKFMKMSSK